MKAQIFTIVMLMFTLVTYAQSSRRGEQGRSNNQNSSNQQTSRNAGVVTRSSTRENNNQPSRTNENVSSHRSSAATDRPASIDHNQPARDNRSSGSSDMSSHRSDNNGRNGAPSANDSHRGGNNGITSSSSRRGPSDNYRISTESGHHSGRVVRPQNSYRHAEVVHYQHERGYIHHEWYHRRPIRTHIYWTVNLHSDFRILYPEVRVWRYPVGYEIVTIPAYEANDYVGEVVNIYGKVVEVYYAYQNDEYYMYFGDYYPYHDFSIVVPGYEARLFSRYPERYFENSYITVTGYVTSNEDKPEIMVRRANQIEIY